MPWLEFVVDRLPELGLRLGEHLALTGASTAMAILVGVPAGVLALRSPIVKQIVLAAVGVLQTVPSLALLALLLALLGQIGALPAVIALTLYALLPIVRNTIVGLEGVSRAAMEAAEGIGMTPRQRLFKVQLPLAMPVIVAGLRTAAVMGVGIATLAAFIGAGGLGQIINRGIYLNDYRLILLGAIPSAALALLVDFVMAAAGWVLDPVRRAQSRRKSSRLAGWAILALPLSLLVFGVVAYFRPAADVSIGSKMFSESLILGHMMELVIEDRTDLTVKTRFGLGGTLICHEAVRVGEIDLYAEYTGTSLTAVLNEPSIADPDAVLTRVTHRYRDKFDLAVLEPFGINNTYAIAVRREAAEANNWRSISDLQRDANELMAGWTPEFAERPDGYPGLREAYGFEYGRVKDLDSGLMYDAVKNGSVDVIAAYSTDGRIDAYDLALLEDDRNFFPPYYAVPVVNGDTLGKYPEISTALTLLANSLDDSTMQRLNYAVDHHKRKPREVAREFLIERGLLNE